MGERNPLKPLHFSILLVLSEREDYGYGIVKRISARDVGGIRIAPSNLYYTLDQLVDGGLIEQGRRSDSEDPRRTYFAITPEGRGVLRAEAERLAALVETAGRLKVLAGGDG